ncbi:MAG: DUF4037 domain-containing protein [Collinsella sp.]|nr:DUF4037 domain-containing protein [Collinsella sp.]
MELTERYAWDVALPALARALGDDADALAVGSVGDGSDRFGFDDGISQDHDWGVSLCVWVPDGSPELSERVNGVMRTLPREYQGFPVLGFGAPCPPWRAGSWTVGEHYRRFCGTPKGPITLEEWERIPEEALAAATNGKVFHDGEGSFTAIRERLLAGYPRIVELRRIASRCRGFAQAGQSNLVRAVLRGDRAGAHLAYSRAHASACLLVHALVGRYCPYYKWEHASTAFCCGEMGREVAWLLEELVDARGPLQRMDAVSTQNVVERLASRLCAGLESRGLRGSSSSFLLDQADYIAALADDG